MGREVVLQAEAKRCRPLVLDFEKGLFLEGIDTIGDMININSAVYRQFQYSPS